MLRELCDQGGIAGLMLTNPNTVGIFEKNIKEICAITPDPVSAELASHHPARA